MDTSDFRKPRPDFPIVPQTAILRPRVKGFKVPKGRKGKKPRGKAVRQGITALKPPNRYQQARTQEIAENARDRRERLRLERDIAKETTRYRVAKAEREEQRAAVRVIEGARERRRQDRLIEDQARHFTELLDRSERRAGEVQAQYKEFLQQVLSQRNLEYKEPEIKFFKAGGTLFEEEVDIEEVGGLRKAEVVQPSAAVVASFGEAGLELEPQEVPAAVAQSPRYRQRQRRGGVAAVPKRKGLEQEITDEGISPPVEASRLLVKAQEEQGAVGGGQSPRDFFKAQIKQPKTAIEIAEAGQKLAREAQAELDEPTPEVPKAQTGLEAIRQKAAADPQLAAARATSAQLRLEAEQEEEETPKALDVFDESGGGSVRDRRPPPSPAEEVVAPPAETGLRRRRGGRQPQPQPEPEPAPAPEPAPVDEDELAREFLATAKDRYGELQEGQSQTLAQIELSDEYLRLIGAKEKPVKFSTIEKQLVDTPIQLKGKSQEFYLKIGEGFEKAGAGKQAGVYKLRNLPSAEGKQKRTTMVLQSVFGSGKTGVGEGVYEDIATLNPYKQTAGVNQFRKAEAEGKLRFFVKDVESDEL